MLIKEAAKGGFSPLFSPFIVIFRWKTLVHSGFWPILAPPVEQLTRFPRLTSH
jgi:hypothetical protein